MPLQRAQVWDRYSNNNNQKYFGGIVSFNIADFEKINGFPNNFWGWGGEDDELMKRVGQCKFTRTEPLAGSITDMEEMDLQDKLSEFVRPFVRYCIVVSRASCVLT